MILVAWYWIINRNMILLLIKCTDKIAEPPKSYSKLESNLDITKAVNESFKNQVFTLKRHYWSNAEYSRQETPEISGIPENIDNGELERKVLTFCQNLISILILQMLKLATRLNQTKKAERYPKTFQAKGCG